MGTEFMAICLQCREYCDTHKLHACIQVADSSLLNITYECPHYHDDDPTENCIFWARGEGKFKHWFEKLERFMKEHPYTHYPIYVSEHTDIYMDMGEKDELYGGKDNPYADWVEFEPETDDSGSD